MSIKRRIGRKALRWGGLLAYWLIKRRVKKAIINRKGKEAKRHYDYEVKK